MNIWIKTLFLLSVLPGLASADDADRLFKHSQTAFEFTAVEYGLELLQESASMGHSGAQYMLGMLHLRGKGVEPSKARVQYWLERSAYEGNEMALLQLGVIHFHSGRTGRQKAFDIFQTLSRKSIPDADYYLGVLYFSGEASRIDFEQSRKLLTKAAESGHPKAQFSLYLLEKLLLGIDGEESDGIAWLKQSAEGGYSPAQYALSHLYQDGVLAGKGAYRHWLSLAASSGFKPALKENDERIVSINTLKNR